MTQNECVAKLVKDYKRVLEVLGTCDAIQLDYFRSILPSGNAHRGLPPEIVSLQTLLSRMAGRAKSSLTADAYIEYQALIDIATNNWFKYLLENEMKEDGVRQGISDSLSESFTSELEKCIKRVDLNRVLELGLSFRALQDQIGSDDSVPVVIDIYLKTLYEQIEASGFAKFLRSRDEEVLDRFDRQGAPDVSAVGVDGAVLGEIIRVAKRRMQGDAHLPIQPGKGPNPNWKKVARGGTLVAASILFCALAVTGSSPDLGQNQFPNAYASVLTLLGGLYDIWEGLDPQ